MSSKPPISTDTGCPGTGQRGSDAPRRTPNAERRTPISGTLYVVATPIGNLEDVTARALRVLREAALVAAEDTRVTRKLLSHFEIHTPLTSCHEHTPPAKIESLVGRLSGGADIALVSDAGTPGISDPGLVLVRAALSAGIPVVPVPGPSALAAALSAGGMDAQRFVFEGFLPRRAGERRKVLERLRPLPHLLVFYEAPERLAGTLTDLREGLGDRHCAVARELTKRFEEWLRGRLSEVEAHFREHPPRGELVILVEGGTPETPRPSAEQLDERLRELLEAGLSVRDAARTAAAELGASRRQAYARAVEIEE